MMARLPSSAGAVQIHSMFGLQMVFFLWSAVTHG